MSHPDRRTVLLGGAAAALALTSACSSSGPATPSPGQTPSPAKTPVLSATTPTGITSTGTTPTGTTPPASTAPPTGPALEVVNGPRAGAAVALTFHGFGDPALTLALLDAAESRGAHVTVLGVGTWLADSKTAPVLERLKAGGHELGNHTYDHPSLRRLGPAATLAEITRCRDVLLTATGTAGRFFRPSGTPTATPEILAAAGLAGYRTSLAYDVDPEDYREPGAKAVQARVLAAVRPGSIVSLHLGHRGTVDAMPGVLDGFAAKGLTAVTASTLLPA